MTNKLFFSIILPTYNRLESIKAIFLPSLEKQIFENYEIIIIDDASSDSTFEFLSSNNFKNLFPKISKKLTLIKNTINIGLPGSRNIGINHSSTEWIFMVEDDLELVGDDFLSKARNLCDAFSDEFSVLTPQLLENSKGQYLNCFDGFSKVGILSGEIYLNPLYPKIEKNTKAAHACSIIKKSVFTKIKYQTTKGRSFREETDFYFYLRKSGFKIIYLGNLLTVKHYGSELKNGGTREIDKNIFKKEFSFYSGHFQFLKNHFKYPKIRMPFFFFVRNFKHFANITNLSIIKKILAKLNI